MGGAQSDEPSVTIEDPELLESARNGYVGLCKLLASTANRGRVRANVNCRDPVTKFTPLHICIAAGDLKAVKLILQQPGLQIDTPNGDMLSALAFAIKLKSCDIATLLLNNGAQSDACDASGRTPLDIALIGGEPNCISLMLKRTPPEDYTSKVYDLNPLSKVVFHELPQFIPLLLERGVTPDYCTKNGTTALHTACQLSNYAEMVYHLFEHTSCSVNVTDKRGITPLHIAAKRNLFDLFTFLIDHGAIPQSRNIHGNTPLHYCAVHGNSKMAEILLNRGLRPDTENHHGKTPLSIAISNRHELLEEMMLAKIPKTISRSSFRIQCTSDLHLEYKTHPVIIPQAPYLALLGDTCLIATQEDRDMLREYLLSLSTKFKLIFVVMGNHEFYKSTLHDAKRVMKEICDSISGIRLMFRSSFVVDGIRVIGTTLWTYIPPHAEAVVSSTMTDYRLITKENNEKITCHDINSWHTEDVTFIKREILHAQLAHEQLIVLTHHAPVINLCSTQGLHYNTKLIHGLCTDHRDLLGSPVSAWLYGHTHWFHDQVINGTRLVSNPHGYPSKEPSYYNPSYVVEIRSVY
ncbi:Ser/Thr protein phosphatase [Pelomyxa schiedti]|nr:Ser/Thr protein phosphatase [Pelomyxa schiedti]